MAAFNLANAAAAAGQFPEAIGYAGHRISRRLLPARDRHWKSSALICLPRLYSLFLKCYMPANEASKARSRAGLSSTATRPAASAPGASNPASSDDAVDSKSLVRLPADRRMPM